MVFIDLHVQAITSYICYTPDIMMSIYVIY